MMVEASRECAAFSRFMKITKFACCLFLFAAFISARAGDDMDFHIYQPCDGNGSMCSPYILANGLITSETPEKFDRFLEKNKKELYDPTIYFNSLGGNLVGGMNLARVIRNKKLNTYIGMADDVDFNFSSKEYEKRYKTIVKKSVCYSACAYAFLGGVSRKIDKDSGSYGVHQFYSNGDYSEDSVQITSSLLSVFLDEMGVDRKLLDFASFTKKDDMFLLKSDFAKSMRVENFDEKSSSWDIKNNSEGDLFVCSSVKKEGSDSLTTLCLSRIGNSLLATVAYRSSSKYLITDAVGIFDNNSLSLKAGNKEIALIDNGVKWKSVGDSIIKNFMIEKDMIIYLLNANSLSIDSTLGGGGVNQHFDPSVTFVTDGLNGAIKALLR